MRPRANIGSIYALFMRMPPFTSISILYKMPSSQNSQHNSAREELSYQIINPYKNFGEGDINSIADRRKGYWRSLIGSDKIIIRCGFKHYCKVTYMEARVQDVHLLELVAFKEDKYKFEDMKLITPKEREGEQIIKHQFTSDALVDQIEVQISSFSKKQLGIYFINFYGFIEEEKPKARTIQKAGKHLAEDSQDIQDNQRRLKEDHKQAIDEKVIEDLAKNKFGHYKIDKKAIAQEMSLKNKIKANEPLLKENGFEQEKLVEDLQANKDLGKDMNYKLIKIKKEKLEIFQGITEKWILAQKKFQFQESVATKHQLSVYIEPRCFKDQIFCFANIVGNEKTQLIRLVREMGGIVREEACQGCIFVTTTMKGSTVGIAKLMKDVIFVNPAYVHDCHRLKSRLGIRQYSHKINQNFLYKTDNY